MICGILLLFYFILGALAAPSSFTSASPTSSSSGPFELYVEGSSPGSASIDDSDDEDKTMPGFNHMPMNESSPIDDDNTPYMRPTNTDGIDFESCKYVTLGGHGKVGETTLDGKCKDKAGQWWQTSLNLNECAANDAGTLIYREGGNFDESCRPCVVSPSDDNGLQLKCNCINGSGVPQYAYLPVGSHVDDPLAVKPVDGQLICGKRAGSKSPSYSTTNPLGEDEQ